MAAVRGQKERNLRWIDAGAQSGRMKSIRRADYLLIRLVDKTGEHLAADCHQMALQIAAPTSPPSHDTDQVATFRPLTEQWQMMTVDSSCEVAPVERSTPAPSAHSFKIRPKWRAFSHSADATINSRSSSAMNILSVHSNMLNVPGAGHKWNYRAE